MANEIIPDSNPNPESALGYDGTDFRTLKVDTDGHPQVDVLTSALPAGAATAENQNAQLMELELIDDLRSALASVGTNTLLVKGKDQLFSFKDQILMHVTTLATTATMTLISDAVPAGEIWEVTHVSARNNTRAALLLMFGIRLNSTTCYWLASGSTESMGVPFGFVCHMYLKAGNRVAVYFGSCMENDSLEMNVNGYKMTKET